MSSRMLVVTAYGALLVLAPISAYAQSAGASIRGQIVAAETGRPLRRARIVVAPDTGAESVVRIVDAAGTASTNVDGRYEIRDLPEGRYRVSVGRSGDLPLHDGQRLHP